MPERSSKNQESCLVYGYPYTIARNFFMLDLALRDAPPISPGQFVQIDCGDTIRHPFSVCLYDEAREILTVAFEKKGTGTEFLKSLHTGDRVDAIVGLGNGYDLAECEGKNVLLVGGGTGAASLLYAADVINKRNGEAMRNGLALIGARTATAVILEEHFANRNFEVAVCTDDGTGGFAGTTIDYLHSLGDALSEFDFILACGPRPMLEELHELAERYEIPLQVSMQEYIACGFGACKGCAINLWSDDGNTTQMGTVCTDGPVFNSRKVVW